MKTPTAAEALDIIEEHGSEDLKRLVELTRAGPIVNRGDEQRLAKFRPQYRPLCLCVKLAIAERIVCAN